MEDFKLDTVPYLEFTNHLNESKNVFFSGVFGIGKTTYLKEFFTEYEYLYNCFHLYPVNYSISSNQDVFELLKYDLLFELIQKKELDKNYVQNKDTLKAYAKENWFDLIINLVQYIPQIGKSIKGFSNQLEQTTNDIKELYGKEFNTEIDSFINVLEKKSGFLYENDLITKYINTQLILLKEENRKENVLILDDLDRIDPDHIFRLLNVFSASFDENRYNQNRFSFDKIIIVADFNSLKSIYNHKFGENSNFKGYINKFYTKKVFHLTFKESLLSKFKIHCTIYPEEYNIFYLSLLELLFNNGDLDFRQLDNLVKSKETPFIIKNIKEFFNSICNIYNNDKKATFQKLKKISFDDFSRIYNYKFILNFILTEIINYHLTINEIKEKGYTHKLNSGNSVMVDVSDKKVRGNYNINLLENNNTPTKEIWSEFIHLIKEINNFN
ncbi:P-loop NTPase fold protein [Tenacibaculum sp. 190524A02b]|uniref:P-loop NTPase fold protein n=1 Tax=Tenacibaculum vairaonense TaxID=3137860 RepID=UPI0031FA6360